MSPEKNKSTSASPDPTFDGDMERDILILVVGDAGAGKSYFINRLLSAIGSEKEASEGHTLAIERGTRTIEPILIEEKDWLKRYIRITMGQQRFIVVDTPGLDVTNPTTTAQRFADWMKRSFPGPLDHGHVLVGGVVYLHDISQSRIRKTTHPNLLALRNSLGVHLPWSSVVLVTTKWKYADEKVNAKAAELRDEHWNPLLKSGDPNEVASVRDFKAGTLKEEEATALEIVQPILKRVEVWMERGAMETLQQVQGLFRGMHVKNQLFTQQLSGALDKAVGMHGQISAVGVRLQGAGGSVSEDELRQLENDWRMCIEEIEGLVGQFSTWDKVLLALQILFPRLLGRLYRTK